MQNIVKKLEQHLDITLHQPDLLRNAFRHTSYVNERMSSLIEHNERLEFLGDAVLEVLISEFLYGAYPKLSEGELTRMRAQLVCEASLSSLARRYQFDQYLQLGKGEETNGGRQRDSILADCFEAVLGALYLDQGLNVVRRFLDEAIFQHHQQIIQSISVDYKTRFQEMVQQQGSVKIQYQLLERTGPAHDLTFIIGLYVENQLIAKGVGKSKKQAEMRAAEYALQCVDEKGRIRRVLSEN